MHLEALKSQQKEIFPKLKNFQEFYLVGGTALALQMGHRISVDFDLFSDKDIPKTLLSKAKRVFKEFKIIKIIVNHSGQLSLLVNDVKIDFVKYNFPPVSKFVEFDGLNLLSVSEIAAMKARTLNHRGTFKDYVDLYFILKEGLSTLEKIKKLAEKKYKGEFNFRLFLEQLVYLKDIKDEKIK